MKKSYIKIIVSIIVFTLIVLLLVPDFWAKHRASRYLEEKYGDAIVVKNVEFDKVQANLFRQEYSARAYYEGVNFRVSNGSDTYTERYHEWRYGELLFINGMESLIKGASITMMEHLTGTAVLDKTDLLFYMDVEFRDTFPSEEAFADGVQKVLEHLDFVNLSKCDTLIAYGFIDGQHVCCNVSPMQSPDRSEILMNIKPF